MDETLFTARPLRESDLGEWLRLRLALWDGTREDAHKDEMVDIIEHSDSQHVFVAEDSDGNLIGFLEASIRPFVEDCVTDNVGYLEGWFVEEAYRKKGVGSALVSAAEQWAREKGCTEMASDAEIGNELSVTAHHRLGYQETSRLIHLRKDL
ncbi:GNAT family N-acetyltransferase [soil metagenome]